MVLTHLLEDFLCFLSEQHGYKEERNAVLFLSSALYCHSYTGGFFKLWFKRSNKQLANEKHRPCLQIGQEIPGPAEKRTVIA